MAGRNRNSKDQNKEALSSAIDPVFGQAKAFNINDPEVNPLVKSYLSEVRNEALHTNAISHQIGQVSKNTFDANIYDDEDDSTSIPSDTKVKSDQTTEYLYSIENWYKWFENISDIIWHGCYVFEGYDDESISHLTQLLRFYLQRKIDENRASSFDRHLVNIFRDQLKCSDPDPVNGTLEIDEDWAENLLKTMRNSKIKDLNTVKYCIRTDYKRAPHGLKPWAKYVTSNQPTHTAFINMIDSSNLWTLVMYMTQIWLKEIYTFGKNLERKKMLSQWLLYILLHIPTRLTAEQMSNIRSLAKQAREILNRRVNSNIFGTTNIVIPDELHEHNCPPCPPNLDIASLILAVVTRKYGQHDILEF